MASSFETHWVSPMLPTTLGSRKWMPLTATDLIPYPMINTWAVPQPLETSRLKTALARALQLSPLNAARMVASKNDGTWRFELVNQAIPLTIGSSPSPGPFDPNWKGEKDPDYYDEFPRGSAHLDQDSHDILTKIKVTTWTATGQTSIMFSQSHCLGDGYAFAIFVKTLSDFYQDKTPVARPTHEKFLLPEPFVKPRASYTDALKNISWLAVGYDGKTHHQHTSAMEADTIRVDYTFEPGQVDALWKQAKGLSKTGRLSRGDALAGYLVHVLRSTLRDPPRFVKQMLGYRGQTLLIDGTAYRLPLTTMGDCFIEYDTDLGTNLPHSSAAETANTLNLARLELSDPQHFSDVFALYTHLFKKANILRSFPIDNGFPDAITVNNILRIDVFAMHFGYPGQTWFIEWEAYENIIHLVEANPVRLADGTYITVPGAVSFVTGIRKEFVSPFLQRLEDDRLALLKSTSAKL